MRFWVCVLMLTLPLAVWTTLDDESLPDKLDAGAAVLSEALNVLAEIDNKKLQDIVGKFSTFLGPASALLTFVMLFVPQQDSAELSYMKNSFTQMFNQLNAIENKLDDMKTIVKFENQKAAYVKDIQNINFGYDQAQSMMKELERVRCTEKARCLREKGKIAGRYFHQGRFDVAKNVHNILVGMLTKGGKIVSNMPELLAEESKCDVGRLRSFLQAMVAVSFKGQVVANLNAQLSGATQSNFDRNKEWNQRARDFQDQIYDQIKKCYDNIDTYIAKDVNDQKYQKALYSVSSAVSGIKATLQARYPWISWVVFGFKEDGTDQKEHKVKYQPGDLAGYFANKPGSDADAARKKIIIAIPAETPQKGCNAAKLTANKRRIQSMMDNMSNLILNSRYYYRRGRRYVRTFGWYPYSWKTLWNVAMDHLKKTGQLNKYSYFSILHRGDREYSYDSSVDKLVANTFFDEKWQVFPNKHHYLPMMIAFSQLSCPRPKQCTRAYCSNKGTCYRVPYSTDNLCTCERGYTGDRCEKKEKVRQTEDMLKMVLTIPQIHDVYYKVEDLKNLTATQFLQTQQLVKTLERSLRSDINNLGNRIGQQNQWTQLLTKYYAAVKNLNHVLDIYDDIENGKTYVTKEQWAKYTLMVDGLGLWLKQYNKMMTGKDTSIFGDDPLIIQLINKSWDNTCSEDYKDKIMSMWTITIQNQVRGHLALADALDILKVPHPGFDILKTLERRKQAQLKTLEDRTCKVDLPNSVNFNKCFDDQVSFGFIAHGSNISIACKPEHYKLTEGLECGQIQPVVPSASSILVHHGRLYWPYYAVDGQTPKAWYNMFHTNREDYPWLQLDFGTPQKIVGVSLYARRDCCRGSLYRGKVFVGNQRAERGKMSSNAYCGSWSSTRRDPAGAIKSVNCKSALRGRFMVIQSDQRRTVLIINEVKINPASTAVGPYKGVSDCVKCHCDRHGRLNNECEDFTGKCTCRAHACGHWCEKKSCTAGATALCVPRNKPCQCKPGFCGSTCEKKTCSRHAHHQCINMKDHCRCKPGYAGDTCQFWTCNSSGSASAQTPVGQQCPCKQGWSGKQCTCQRCSSGASNSCAPCKCKSSYYGHLCEKKRYMIEQVHVKNAYGCWGYYYYMTICSKKAGCCNTQTEYLVNRSEKVIWSGSRLGSCRNKDFGTDSLQVYVRTNRNGQYICLQDYGYTLVGTRGSWTGHGGGHWYGKSENGKALSFRFRH